ncbi:MAG: hypothetical protein ACOCWW_01105 [Bacteroidota bacterium]
MESRISTHNMNNKARIFLENAGYVKKLITCSCGTCDAEEYFVNPQIKSDSLEEDFIYDELEKLEKND